MQGLLQRIETLILLDLWGEQGSKFYSLQESTTWLFDRLRNIEKKLKELNMYILHQEC